MPIVRNIQAARTQGRIARAKAGPTSRVTSAPTAKEKAIEMPT